MYLPKYTGVGREGWRGGGTTPMNNNTSYIVPKRKRPVSIIKYFRKKWGRGSQKVRSAYYFVCEVLSFYEYTGVNKENNSRAKSKY